MHLILGKKPGIFDVIIINDNLEDAYDKLKNALLQVSKGCMHILYYQPNSSYNWHHFYIHDNTFLKKINLCSRHLKPKSAAFLNIFSDC